jgi:hypothetical protein
VGAEIQKKEASEEPQAFEGDFCCLFVSKDAAHFSQTPFPRRVMNRTLSLLVSFLLTLAAANAQQEDPCGFPDTTTSFYKAAARANWGYGYDSLLTDLAQWQTSPYVQIDSMGSSVQGRTLFLLTIEDTTLSPVPRKRIWIHARTHPGEVQGTWVTNEIISLLLSESETGRLIRSQCVFSIVPMINPDGVELGFARENANGVDIESNWSATTSEVEVQALRSKFEQLMGGTNPIEVALNMHSAFACKRYFVYHAASGTSEPYAALEQQFIGFVRDYFPLGIEPWSYFVSWTNVAPTVYPESWFWYNHGEAIMALTYEDMNCPAAGSFDTTAFALLSGIANFLGIFPTGTERESYSELPVRASLFPNYPNPFNSSTAISYQLPAFSRVTLRVYDILGRVVATLVDGEQPAKAHKAEWNASVASGVYFYRLEAVGKDGRAFVETKTMVLLK